MVAEGGRKAVVWDVLHAGAPADEYKGSYRRRRVSGDGSAPPGRRAATERRFFSIRMEFAPSLPATPSAARMRPPRADTYHDLPRLRSTRSNGPAVDAGRRSNYNFDARAVDSYDTRRSDP